MVDLVFYLCHLIKVKGLMTAVFLVQGNEKGKGRQGQRYICMHVQGHMWHN